MRQNLYEEKITPMTLHYNLLLIGMRKSNHDDYDVTKPDLNDCRKYYFYNKKGKEIVDLVVKTKPVGDGFLLEFSSSEMSLEFALSDLPLKEKLIIKNYNDLILLDEMVRGLYK